MPDRYPPEQAGTPATSPGDMEWQHPTRNVRICLHALPGSMISGEAVRGLRASRPSEIGGILWGIIGSEADDVSIVITAAEFVQSEGEFFNSTVYDFRVLTRALQADVKAAGAAPVGFFRSHIRDGLCLSEQDTAFVEQHLTDPGQICLLVRPFDFGICMAGFFLWEEGRLQTDFTDFEVPLFAPQSQDLQPTDSSPAGVAEEVEQKNLARDDDADEASKPIERGTAERAAGRFGAERPRKTGERYLSAQTIAIVCLSAILLALAAYVPLKVRTSGVRETRALDPDIGIQVTRPVSGQINLTWNPTLFPDARGGELEIVEGSVHQKVTLDRRELLSGKLAYFAAGPDLVFHMRVDVGGNRSISESIRVMGAESEPIRPQPALGTQSARRAEVTTPRVVPKPIVVKQQPLRSTANKPPSYRFNPPRPSYKARQIPVQAPLLIPSAQSPPTNEAVASILKAGQVPAPPRFPAPVTKADAPKRQDPAPASISDYVPPVPVRRTNPYIGSVMPSGPPSLIQVEVLAKVDKLGQVVEAHAVRPGVLNRACIAAALQWRFRPGTLHGRPIEAVYSIQFQFHPY
jgi:hypothetical protein